MNGEAPYAGLLRSLAFNDAHTVNALLGGSLDAAGVPHLSDKPAALARLAALIATEAAPASYQWSIAEARAAGAAEDDIVGVLLSVAPIVGVARLTSAALLIAASLDVEIDVLGET